MVYDCKWCMSLHEKESDSECIWIVVYCYAQQWAMVTVVAVLS